MPPIEQDIRVTGAQESKRQLDEVADGMEGVGEATEESGKKTGKSANDFGEFGDVIQKNINAVKGFVTGLIGANGLRFALDVIKQSLEETKEVATSFIDSMSAVVALAGDKRLLDVAERASASSGRSVEEVGKSLFAIVSGTGGATIDEQEALLNEALEIGKAEPNASLDAIVELLVRLRNVSGGKLSPQQLQNLAIKTEDLGQVDIGQLASFLPRILPAGQTAGIEISDTSALFALVSQVLKPEQASTGVANILTRLAAPSDAGLDVLKELGADTENGVFGILGSLAGKQLSSAQLRDLVGEGPGASALPVLLDQFDRLKGVQDEIARAVDADAKDLGARKVDVLRGSIPNFRDQEDARRREQERLAATRDPEYAAEAFTKDQVRDLYELAQREAGVGSVARAINLKIFDFFSLFKDSIEALRYSIDEDTFEDPDLLVEELVDTIVSGAPGRGLAQRARDRANVKITINNIGTQYTGQEPGRVPEYEDLDD